MGFIRHEGSSREAYDTGEVWGKPAAYLPREEFTLTRTTGATLTRAKLFAATLRVSSRKRLASNSLGGRPILPVPCDKFRNPALRLLK